MLPFVTIYDPLGGSAGSIDPLGALQAYGTLADLLLPGVTTVTSRSRYLSMICAALANAQKHCKFPPGAAGLAQRRKAVEPFERFWALACVAAKSHGHTKAADGLRGISYAEKNYRKFSEERRKVDCKFPFLKSQSRTGAVGAYWTTMVGGQLVDADSGVLFAEGEEIAAEFPPLPLPDKELAKLADPESADRVSVAFEDFLEWSGDCHLNAPTPRERERLGEALTAEDRRDCVCEALQLMRKNLPDEWEIAHLMQLGGKLADLPRAVELKLPVVIDAIVATEQFHEAVLRLFETLLWWGTQKSEKPIHDLLEDSDFRKSADRCRATASKLRQFRDQCEVPPVRAGIDGLVAFAIEVDRSYGELELVKQVIDRHHRVQSGKLHGGVPKSDWIGWDNVKLLRPSPRFQITERPIHAAGDILTHPYRLEQFAHMLGENGWLSWKSS